MTDVINFVADALSKAELVELIEYHNHRYWELGEPEIADSRYDELMRALAKFDPEHPLLTAVYAPAVASLGSVRLTEPMLSLNKAYSFEKILDWAQKIKRFANELFLIEPKYDGISVCFDGKTLITRGAGEEGEDISDKIELIELETKNYVGKLNQPARGELLIRNDDFHNIYSRIVKSGGGHYKNSRNAVGGIVGLKDTALEMMKLQKAKLTLVDYSLISYPVNFDELKEQWEDILSQLRELPYPQDGVVIKIADENYAHSLGNTAHHPRGAIAYKFGGDEDEDTPNTILRKVEWTAGKNCLTPVATFDPLDITGTTIKRATLHNAKFIETNDIQIGDAIKVIRAGDVIPKISARGKVNGKDRTSALISHCPFCNSKLVRKGPELCCVSADCKETILQRLLAAIRNFGIEHLGEPTLRKMMEIGRIRHLGDLFELTAKDILQLEGFATKSAANLIEEIQKARIVNDYQVLAALNLPAVGINIAKAILTHFSLQELPNVTVEQLAAIQMSHKIGQKESFRVLGMIRAKAIHQELVLNTVFLEELLSAVKVIRSAGGEKLPTICFTGKMPEKRSYYEKLAKSAGYEPVSEANSSLGLLVAMDVNENSTKLKNARKNNVKIVSLDEFLKEIVPAEDNAASQVEVGETMDLF